jgi:hypothetical protein
MPDPNPNPEAAVVEKPAEAGTQQTPSLVVEGEEPIGAPDPKLEEKPTETPAEEEAKGAASEVPEEYEIALPEGVDPKNVPILDEAVPVFKELGLTNEQAQKLVDFEFARQAKQTQQWVEQRDAWTKEVKDDPELGRDNLEANMKLSGKAIRGLLGDEHGKAYLDFLKNTGFDNHPKQFRLLVAIGKRISEDTVSGSAPGSGADQPKTLAERMYPDNPK